MFLYISSTSTEAQFCLLTLEIINHVLREQSPSELASAGQSRTEKEQENDRWVKEREIRRKVGDKSSIGAVIKCFKKRQNNLKHLKKKEEKKDFFTV